MIRIEAKELNNHHTYSINVYVKQSKRSNNMKTISKIEEIKNKAVKLEDVGINRKGANKNENNR